MNVLEVLPSSTLVGTFTVPADKSITHRAILLGMIAKGTTTIYNPLVATDCLALLNAAKALGVRIDVINDKQWLIHGVGKYGLKAPKNALDLGNSGTAVRLLLGIIAGLDIEVKLIGDASLSQRPMERVLKPLKKMGANFVSETGKLPIYHLPTKSLKTIRYQLPVASAQVKSALLLAGLYCDNGIEIIEPIQTRNHTEKLYPLFGVTLNYQNNTHYLSAVDALKAATIKVPGDFSSAAFFISATLLAKKGHCLIKGVGINPTRTGFLTLIEKMGAKVYQRNLCHYGLERVCDIEVFASSLQAIEADASMVAKTIDEYPLLFLLASQAKGTSVFSGLSELKVKESDRLVVMANILQKMGVKATLMGDDAIEICGQQGIKGGLFDAKNDHRIAMTVAISALVSEEIITIKNAKNIETSFPSFTKVAAKLGLEIGEKVTI